MSRKTAVALSSVSLALMLAGCSRPSAEYALGQATLSEDFSSEEAWEYYLDENAGNTASVTDGAYRIEAGDEGYIWGLNQKTHADVVMEVTTSQLSAFENNAYGVMCRADVSNNGDGYYFMISGDGFYSIARGEGEDVTPIVDWTGSGAISSGTRSNVLRAVCIGDYLAFYVNDKFLADTNDSAYDSGYAGFAATAFEGGDVAVTFDDLTVWQATLAAH